MVVCYLSVGIKDQPRVPDFAVVHRDLTPTIPGGSSANRKLFPSILTSQTSNESEMALFNECMQSCAHIVLDTADIVRDGDSMSTNHE